MSRAADYENDDLKKKKRCGRKDRIPSGLSGTVKLSRKPKARAPAQGEGQARRGGAGTRLPAAEGSVTRV